jgi:hypothetical protein
MLRRSIAAATKLEAPFVSARVANAQWFSDLRMRGRQFFNCGERVSFNLEAVFMKPIALFVCAALITTPLTLLGQSSPSVRYGSGVARPLSQFAFDGGVSPMGIQLQTATNLNSHFNLRGTGNFFNYSTTFTVSGVTAAAKLNLASAGASLDIYPFRSGFRISPGALFHNENQLTAAATVPGGTSFTLNGQTFYSANANAVTGATPVNGSAALGLNTNKTALSITTGWGNMIPRKGGHFSFPFEIGAAFIGAPTLSVNLGGWVCLDQAQTNCSNFASTTNPIGASAQSALQTQEAKWVKDLSLLKTYPIVSGGLAYSFGARR